MSGNTLILEYYKKLIYLFIDPNLVNYVCRRERSVWNMYCMCGKNFISKNLGLSSILELATLDRVYTQSAYATECRHRATSNQKKTVYKQLFNILLEYECSKF